MVKIIEKWKTVYFVASKKGYNDVTLTLSLDCVNKKYDICTTNEEAVSFKNDSIDVSKMKLEALIQAIKYLEKELKQ